MAIKWGHWPSAQICIYIYIYIWLLGRFAPAHFAGFVCKVFGAMRPSCMHLPKQLPQIDIYIYIYTHTHTYIHIYLCIRPIEGSWISHWYHELWHSQHLCCLKSPHVRPSLWGPEVPWGRQGLPRPLRWLHRVSRGTVGQAWRGKDLVSAGWISGDFPWF